MIALLFSVAMAQTLRGFEHPGGLLWVPVGKTYAITYKNHKRIYEKATLMCAPKNMRPESDELYVLGDKKKVQKKKMLQFTYGCF